MTQEEFLAHHGILGQKWGVRRYQNSDGTLTEAGKKRYTKKAQDIISKAKRNEDVSAKVFDAIGADKKYLKRANNILAEEKEYQKEITKETDEMFKELESKDKIHFYEAASELAEHAEYFGANGKVEEMTVGDMGSVGFYGVLDDGQQGTINAYSMYALEHNLGTRIDKLHKDSVEHEKNSITNAKDCLKTAFKNVGLDELPAYKDIENYSAAGKLISQLREAKYDAYDGQYRLADASYASRMTEKDKDNTIKASKYVSKIKNSNNENTWWYVSEAAENLGMDSVKLKNMTQADWNKLNAEIADLRAAGR